MMRVRWLAATWPYGMRTLAARLKPHTFQADTNDGFLLERVRDTSIHGRHFEKIFFEEVIRDPFGNQTTFNRLSYREVEFVFSATYPQIELRHFPRGLHTFFTRTSQATEFTTAFLAIQVDVLGWADKVRSMFPKHFRIDLAQLSDVYIEEDVTAKMVLSSQHDIRAAFARFADGRKHTVDRVQIQLEHVGTTLSLQLSADGTLRTPEALPDEVLDIIRRTLPVSAAQTDGS
jgi:hypothetical protein